MITYSEELLFAALGGMVDARRAGGGLTVGFLAEGPRVVQVAAGGWFSP